MKTIIKFSTVICIIVLVGNSFSTLQSKASASPVPANPEISSNKIQVALLLDASNSMDGLIDQAKSRLWNIVNTLTTLRYEGKVPQIEIALYMYGNDGLSEKSNYIKQMTPFTSDLDVISEKLFAIKTNGGSEYCGAVIVEAVKKLDWGREKADMRLIYIAGNEPFTQGSVSYQEAISEATKKDIFINTIFCGDYAEGVNTNWKDGARIGNGQYFNINQDQRIVYIVTPYDDAIQRCNERLNMTYIYYGNAGITGYQNQSAQDQNSIVISKSNYTERAVSKSKKLYNNSGWDLVDKVALDSLYIDKIEIDDLPPEYINLTNTELKTLVAEKTKEREEIQKEINSLAAKRQDYIDNQSKTEKSDLDDLGKAINVSILNLATSKGYNSEN